MQMTNNCTSLLQVIYLRHSFLHVIYLHQMLYFLCPPFRTSLESIEHGLTRFLYLLGCLLNLSYLQHTTAAPWTTRELLASVRYIYVKCCLSGILLRKISPDTLKLICSFQGIKKSEILKRSYCVVFALLFEQYPTNTADIANPI